MNSSDATRAQPLGRPGDRTAANDDAFPARAPRHPDGGWDPYEVWRTRVRDARRLATPPAA